MFSSQYKGLVKRFGLLTKNFFEISCRKTQQNITKSGSCIGWLGNHYAFGVKKPDVKTKKEEKQLDKENKVKQQIEYLWKTNLALTMLGIGAGFYVPNQAVTLVLTSSSIFQVCELSKYIDQLKVLTEKGHKQNSSDSDQFVSELRQVFKKIVISLGLILTVSIAISFSTTKPSFKDYSLFGLNFWILYNIKFHGLSHGYYFVLLGLAAFQYLYFQKVFDKNKQQIPFQLL